jgi:hypothetical protein
MSDLGTILTIAAVGIGGYAVYRWLEDDKGERWKRRESKNLREAHATGYFAGVQSGPAIVGHYGYVGDGRTPPPPPDPRNCLCPMSLDPLDPTLPVYKCPCNVPGAVHPPYAGYMAVGRGGGGGHFHPHHHYQQQFGDEGGGGGFGGDGGQQPFMPPQYQPHPHFGGPHGGRRR